jgi:hypothetical protein
MLKSKGKALPLALVFSYWLLFFVSVLVFYLFHFVCLLCTRMGKALPLAGLAALVNLLVDCYWPSERKKREGAGGGAAGLHDCSDEGSAM